MHVWGGAGIPPEPQLTQTQKNIAAWQTCRAWIQLWHNFTGFSTSILAKIQATGSQSERKLEFYYFRAEQHIQDTCQSFVLCTRPMHHAICLSVGQLLI